MVGWYFSASGVYISHGDGVLGGSGDIFMHAGFSAKWKHIGHILNKGVNSYKLTFIPRGRCK